MDASAAPTAQAGECKRVVVRTKDGRVFDLGDPKSIFFKLRVMLYRWKRRRELNG